MESNNYQPAKIEFYPTPEQLAYALENLTGQGYTSGDLEENPELVTREAERIIVTDYN